MNTSKDTTGWESAVSRRCVLRTPVSRRDASKTWACAVTKTDLQTLAEMRLREAGILLAAGELDGAYYVAGYAVEFALKACIIKRKLAVPEYWPEKSFTQQCHTHDLSCLMELADLETEVKVVGAGSKLVSRERLGRRAPVQTRHAFR